MKYWCRIGSVAIATGSSENDITADNMIVTADTTNTTADDDSDS